MEYAEISRIAHKLARELINAKVEEKFNKRTHKIEVIRGVDKNEVGKLFSYIKEKRDIKDFFELMNRLPNSGLSKRSKKTKGYFEALKDILQPELKEKSVDDAVKLMGLIYRLMTYYSK